MYGFYREEFHMRNKDPISSNRKQFLQVIIPLLIFIAVIVLIHLSKNVFIPEFKRHDSCRRLQNRSVEVGEVICLGRQDLDNEWQVIAIEDSRALLINKNYVRILSFDAQENRMCSHLGNGAHMTYPYIKPGQQGIPVDEWDESGIKTWLNEVYLPYEFNRSETDLMCDCGYGNVFLLSADEYEKYVKGHSDLLIKYPWWLRTSKTYEEGTFPDYVMIEGDIATEPVYRGSVIAIRPAMWIALY